MTRFKKENQLQSQVLNIFSNHLKVALKNASYLASQLGHKPVETEHLILGLMSQRGSLAGEILLSLGLNSEKLKTQIQPLYPVKVSDLLEEVGLSKKAKEIINLAVKIAYQHKHKYVGSEHLLAAIIQSDSDRTMKIFKEAGLDQIDLERRVTNMLKSSSKLSEITDNFKNSYDFEKVDEEAEQEESRSLLDFFGKNLCSPSTQKKIDPVIAREKEIDRIIEILCRRTKNNPLLLGDPGVGKTAIVEGLAKKILHSEVPSALLDKKIYSISMPSLVAGTSYRGEFENRIKQLIEEVSSRPDVILFIDELHTIVGAGSASGSMDAANILKPALARGEIRCIGATTFSDYRKSIENDPALERRFQTIKIEEPDSDSTKKILTGIRPYFENFHKVIISDEAIESAIELTQKYQPEKFLPDKAIDVIDEAAAAIKIKRKLSKTEEEAKKIKNSLSELNRNIKQAINSDQLELADKIKEQADLIKENIELLNKKISQQNNKFSGKIGSKEITQVVAKQSGIDASSLLSSEDKKISKLEKEINNEVLGQEQAISCITKKIKISKAGLSSQDKPLASFLFIGPSGVGKTYTAQLLAEKLFGDRRALIRIDMSEYGEKFNASKLIGAPAGYVGYKESGQLTEKVKHRPHSLILLDEVEKANKEIFDLLLQVLDGGELTDASGRKINFRNTVIIMTSNIGSRFTQGRKDIGFLGQEKEGLLENKILKEVKEWFRPEFISRIDKTVFFKHLDDKSLKKIISKETKKLEKAVHDKKKIKIKTSQSVIELILKKSKESEQQSEVNQGVRAIKKMIQEELESAMSEIIISPKIKLNKTIQLKAKNGIIKAS